MPRRKSTEKCEILEEVEVGYFYRVVVVENLTVTIDWSFYARRCVCMKMCVC